LTVSPNPNPPYRAQSDARTLAPPRRLDRRKARVAARAIADKRRHARARLPLAGRTLYENGREIDCDISSISAGGLAARSPVTPRVNSHIVIVLEALGRVEGRVARVDGELFALRFDAMTERKRLRFADEIAWEGARRTLHMIDDRRAPRRGKTGSARIAFYDGMVARADYIDVSDVGASFAAIERPRPGELAHVESRLSQIARVHERGFAVAFEPMPEAAAPDEVGPGPTPIED
jgi:hypothetical protein